MKPQNLAYHFLPFFLMLFVFASCNTKTNEAQADKTASVETQADPLPSWNDGASKKAILDFVTKVTRAGSADYIPVPDRIACFDNDGTLWSEQPLYFQFQFAIDRVKELAPQHPEWKTTEPFSAVLKGDMKAVAAGGEKALIQIVTATQTGMSADAFTQEVINWMRTAKHPKFNRAYNELTYLPMIELLDFLRANNFTTYIVSGGEEGFMCPWVEQAYGIPCEQVVGTLMKSTYEVVNDTPSIVRKAELDIMNDGKGKPVGIYNQIGKRPVFAAGNSDGDYEMLQYTTTSTGYPRFGMIIHHTDSIREFAYDRKSHIGHLERGLDDAAKYNWHIVDMKNEWKEVFEN